ncbi:MAG: type V CRISPR-associated protein Cas12b [Acidobacteriota bacterium]
MPTRTVKFKVFVPRDGKPDSVDARRALWATHEFVNQAAAFYEELLLEMRQGEVLRLDAEGKETIEPASRWSDGLRQRLRSRGCEEPLIEEALPVLRRLYESVVRSSLKPDTGSAQDGRTYHSPLVDRTSKGGESRRHKMNLFEPLFKRLGEPAEEWESLAKEIIDANPQTLLSATGSPPTWVRRYRRQEPGWAEALAGYLRKEREALAGGVEDPLQWLKEHGVLPIAEPFSQDRIQDNLRLNTFERMAFALTIAHLNSWESWGHRTRAEYEARLAKQHDWEAKYTEPLQDFIAAVRRFEGERSQDLQANALWTERSRYRLRPRELRGWRELREWLRSHRDADAQARTERVKSLQAEMGRDFGSEVVLQWLARRENQGFADHAEDPAVRIAIYNRLTDLVERSRRLPLYTAPDAVHHPRWCGFDPPNNTNQPPFTLLSPVPARAEAELELLCPAESGLLCRRKFRFRLAPSGQFGEGKIEPLKEGKGPASLVFKARAQDGRGEVQGAVGGSNLLFARGALEHREARLLRAGGFGAAFLKVAVDVAEPGSQERLGVNGKLAAWLKSGPEKRAAKPLPKPEEGFSVLSADLGLRSAAAVSVFRVKPSTGPGGEGIWAPGAVSGFAVAHERSALLKLPGEDPGKREMEARRNEDRTARQIAASISALRTACRLWRVEEAEKREKILDELLSLERVRTAPALMRQAEGLRGLLAAQDEVWRAAAEPLFLAFEREVGKEVSYWRKTTRPRRKTPLGGKSAWQIEHLERVRRILLSWHRHQRPRAEPLERLDRGRFGTVAAHLLEHVNGLKDDRIKTTADLIVQAARGYVYTGKCWVQRHEPVDVIILEDLSRYLSRTDRPPAENRQLMRWAHREVAKAVEEQAAVYGIAVMDTPARFSSRFDALTRAPGVRCRPATAEYLAFLRSPQGGRLAERLRSLGLDPEALEPADLLPLGDGELLASAGEDGKVRVRHADLNAAQNLALWCLEAYGVQFRLSVARVQEAPPVYAAVNLGKRNKAAFEGAAVVFRAPDGSGQGFEAQSFRSWKSAAKALGLSPGAEPSEAGEEGEGREDLEAAELEEMGAELTGERVTLFRDPSGLLFDGKWVEAKPFWGRVRQETIRRLRASGRLHG